MPYPWQYPKRLIPAVPAWCTCGFPMYLWHLYLAIIHWAGWGSSADPATLTVSANIYPFSTSFILQILCPGARSVSATICQPAAAADVSVLMLLDRLPHVLLACAAAAAAAVLTSRQQGSSPWPSSVGPSLPWPFRNPVVRNCTHAPA